VPGSKLGWSKRPAQVGLARVVDHLDHICQLAGDARHAALGTDLDGGYGREQSPHDLDTIADLRLLAPLLRERGYGEADVAAVLAASSVRRRYAAR